MVFVKTNSKLIREMRTDAGISQEDLADKLHISRRHLARIEAGDADMDVWQFMSMLELLGRPSEDFWMMYLDSGEYEDYRTYRKLKRLLRDDRFTEVREMLPAFEKGSLAKQPFIKQFVASTKITSNPDMPNKQALDGLYEAIGMSIKDFDETKVSKYRLTHNEVHIIACIAIRLFEMGETDRAIDLQKAMIEGRASMRTTEEDKAALLPALFYSLSTMLGRVKKYKESLEACKEAQK